MSERTPLCCNFSPRGQYEKIKSADRDACSGLYWNCCTIDQDNLFVIASWDTAQMNDQEVQQCCDGYAHALRAIANSENWDRGLADALLL